MTLRLQKCKMKAKLRIAVELIIIRTWMLSAKKM